MKVQLHLLIPFDLGLELDFGDQRTQGLIKEMDSRWVKDLTLEGELLGTAEAVTRIFRFGVGVIQITLPLADISLERCARLAQRTERLYAGKNSLSAFFQLIVQDVVAKASAFATYAYERRLEEFDVFPVFLLEEFTRENAELFLKRYYKELFGIVSQEPEYERLSSFVLEQERLRNIGYYENELILIRRFGAVVASSDTKTILRLITLAYGQYWSLKSYNFFLDEELAKAQRLLEGLPPYYKFWLMPQNYQRFSVAAIDFGKDKLAIVDSLYNLSTNLPQIEEDSYLRTVYQWIEKVFNIEESYKVVETKLDRIESSYNSARDFLATNFFIILDFIFFFWLAWSVIDTILLWKISAK